MKCDELQELWFEAYPVEGDQIIPTKVYGKKDADEAITELKCELKDVTDDRNEFKKLYSEQTEKLCIEKTNIDTLEQALNQSQRALWLARGYIMTLLQRDFQRLLCQCNNDGYKPNLARRRNKYYDLHEKCLKKAEEYKFAIPMIGPSMWHNALVVCNGASCTTYTEWTVINENAGVLEVWAGGRLQRFSNGTWHYE